MFLATNRHFDNLAVNVSLSAVLLPNGIRDNGELVIVSFEFNEMLVKKCL